MLYEVITDLLGDTFTSGTFSAASSKIATGSGSMDITLGDTTYQFDYSSSTTLTQMVDAINSDSSISDKVHAAVVKYGNDDYRMVLTAKASMQDQPILVTDNGGTLNTALASDALLSTAVFDSKDALIATDGTPDSTGIV